VIPLSLSRIILPRGVAEFGWAISTQSHSWSSTNPFLVASGIRTHIFGHSPLFVVSVQSFHSAFITFQFIPRPLGFVLNKLIFPFDIRSSTIARYFSGSGCHICAPFASTASNGMSSRMSFRRIPASSGCGISIPLYVPSGWRTQSQ
jgi:hypothetical protein